MTALLASEERSVEIILNHYHIISRVLPTLISSGPTPTELFLLSHGRQCASMVFVRGWLHQTSCGLGRLCSWFRNAVGQLIM